MDTIIQDRNIELFESTYKQITDRSKLVYTFEFIQDLPCGLLIRWLKCIFYILTNGDQNIPVDLSHNDYSLIRCCLKINNLAYFRYIINNTTFPSNCVVLRNVVLPRNSRPFLDLLVKMEVYPFIFEKDEEDNDI